MRLADGRAIPTFITQALLHEPLTVYGDGSQTRSFCYVDDLVEGIVRLLRADYAEPVNLGNPEECAILELARRIVEVTQSPSRIAFRPLPQDDPKQRCPDISLAKRLLGWSPSVTLAEGLDKTVPWFADALPGSATGSR
jgi:nucleoside-diphosphate-sugar epimerase